MSAHYEGWGEHHAYRCGKDDGFTDGFFAATEACIAAIDHDSDCLFECDGDADERDCTCYYPRILDRLRKVQP